MSYYDSLWAKSRCEGSALLLSYEPNLSFIYFRTYIHVYPMTELIFLGSGGGRFMLITQRKATAGFRLHTENFKIHVDPGTGALVRSLQQRLDPQKLNCVITTHAHPDHATDTAVLIEAMCKGMTRERGTLIVSESVMSSKGDVGPVMGQFHFSKPKKAVIGKPGNAIELEENGEKIAVELIKTRHADPAAFGVKFKLGNKVIGYTSDTEYFEELPNFYKGCDVLIMNCTRPAGARINYHLCVDDVIALLKIAKPKLAVITHIGLKFAQEGILNGVEQIEKETGIATIAAEDGMKINVEDSLVKLKQTSLGKFK